MYILSISLNLFNWPKNCKRGSKTGRTTRLNFGQKPKDQETLAPGILSFNLPNSFTGPSTYSDIIAL